MPLAPPEVVRADFDRLADLIDDGWDHNVHYHNWLLARLPARCAAALEVGCGSGRFARRLAGRSGRVVALDLSPRMLERARSAATPTGHAAVEYVEADVRAWPIPPASFDAVVSIATLHHVPLAPTLAALAAGLRPGGVLAVVDLRRTSTPGDLLAGLAAVPAGLALRRLRGGRPESPERRAFWRDHGGRDEYPGLAEVRRAAAEAGLAGADVRRLLLWRYGLTWTRPDVA